MDASQTRHLVHFLRSCVDVSILEVVVDGVVEQHRILTTLQKQNKKKKQASESSFTAVEGYSKKNEGRREKQITKMTKTLVLLQIKLCLFLPSVMLNTAARLL